MRFVELKLFCSYRMTFKNDCLCYNKLMIKSYATIGLVGLSIISAIILSSSAVSADDSYNADVSLTIPVACTMTGTVDTPHTANVDAGTYVADIGTTTLKTVCNDGNGFSIYAIGYSGLEYGNNKMLATVGGTLAPTYDIATGTAQNGNTSNWAMKLNAVTGTYAPSIVTGFDSYHAVPDTYTKVATRTSGTDATVGASIQSTYAVYVTSLQPAGNYNGKVRYTLVHPNTETPLQPVACIAGKICYNANGGNVEGTMGQQDANGSTETVLLASNFSREEYGFAGWSTTFDYSDSTGFYGPQETITTPADTSTNGLSLYAIWIQSAGDLQNWTGCSSLQSGTVTALTDQRDNETYAVAKLADGNCWMIENLRLESTAAHNSDGVLAQGYGISAAYGNFSGLATAETAYFSNSTTANSLYYSGTQSGDATIDIGATDYSGYRMPRYNNTNTSARAVNNLTSNSSAMYSYGNYYTWHAAIADTAHYSGGDHGTTSLCPKGWRLPIGNQSTANMSFGKLSVELGGPANGATADSNSTPTGIEMSKIFRSYPNNFFYSGIFGGSSTSNVGSFGYYWPSTANNNLSSFILQLGSMGVYPGTMGLNKDYGISIRCIISPSA